MKLGRIFLRKFLTLAFLYLQSVAFVVLVVMLIMIGIV